MKVSVKIREKIIILTYVSMTGTMAMASKKPLFVLFLQVRSSSRPGLSFSKSLLVPKQGHPVSFLKDSMIASSLFAENVTENFLPGHYLQHLCDFYYSIILSDIKQPIFLQSVRLIV